MSEIEERVGSESNAVAGVGPSILSSLKERRQQVLNEQVLRLPVPRWDNPTIIVSYKPVDHSFIRKAQTRVEKAAKDRRAETEVDANIDMLIQACVSVVAVIDGKEYSLRPGDPEGEPTRFDPELAANLGVEGAGGRPPTARAVVRELFFTDGDILSASSELVRFSGYRETEADSTLLGE